MYYFMHTLPPVVMFPQLMRPQNAERFKFGGAACMVARLCLDGSGPRR